jgi:TonB family protein
MNLKLRKGRFWISGRSFLFFIKAILFAFCIVIFGCSTSQQFEMPDTLPQVVKKGIFPPLPNRMGEYGNDFDFKLLVGKDGSVLHAELLTPSGDQKWDSLALVSVLQWKFTPAMYKGSPIQIWTTIRADVRQQQPKYENLAEIVCGTSFLADSLFDAIQNGSDFGKLAAQFSAAESRKQNGNIGEVDIHSYPPDIQNVLANLYVNEVTHPIRIDHTFVIFKRNSNGIAIP